MISCCYNCSDKPTQQHGGSSFYMLCCANRASQPPPFSACTSELAFPLKLTNQTTDKASFFCCKWALCVCWQVQVCRTCGVGSGKRALHTDWCFPVLPPPFFVPHFCWPCSVVTRARTSVCWLFVVFHQCLSLSLLSPHHCCCFV